MEPRHRHAPESRIVTGGEWVAVIVALVAALGWLFQLKGRMDTHEAVCAERYKNLQTQMESMNHKMDQILDQS